MAHGPNVTWSLGKFKCVCMCSIVWYPVKFQIYVFLEIPEDRATLGLHCMPVWAKPSKNRRHALSMMPQPLLLPIIFPVLRSTGSFHLSSRVCYHLFKHSSLSILFWSLLHCCRHLSLKSLAFLAATAAETLVGMEGLEGGVLQHWRLNGLEVEGWPKDARLFIWWYKRDQLVV